MKDAGLSRAHAIEDHPLRKSGRHNRIPAQRVSTIPTMETFP